MYEIYDTCNISNLPIMKNDEVVLMLCFDENYRTEFNNYFDIDDCYQPTGIFIEGIYSGWNSLKKITNQNIEQLEKDIDWLLDEFNIIKREEQDILDFVNYIYNQNASQKYSKKNIESIISNLKFIIFSKKAFKKIMDYEVDIDIDFYKNINFDKLNPLFLFKNIDKNNIHKNFKSYKNTTDFKIFNNIKNMTCKDFLNLNIDNLSLKEIYNLKNIDQKKFLKRISLFASILEGPSEMCFFTVPDKPISNYFLYILFNYNNFSIENLNRYYKISIFYNNTRKIFIPQSGTGTMKGSFSRYQLLNEIIEEGNIEFDQKKRNYKL